MPKAVKAKKVHFFDRFVSGPIVDNDAVGSDEDTGSVLTESAMYKDRSGRLPNE